MQGPKLESQRLKGGAASSPAFCFAARSPRLHAAQHQQYNNVRQLRQCHPDVGRASYNVHSVSGATCEDTAKVLEVNEGARFDAGSDALML